MRLPRLQLRLDLAVALGQLRTHEIEGIQRLFEFEQMFGPPVALQAARDFIDAGMGTGILDRTQYMPVAFTSDYGANSLMPRLAF